ncbi:TetR/AcrR family transcriptional regulator [Microlunatus parietis]|uniref:AcrR family transcriptional regulator n=1 Tax=Microlunatus parietis TaxID=682979 RepID=A0A7Y9I9Z1_9ACTN|nr:TetR/AcrR family transcriptional regulator [Microlunatus parietis]NYE72927.1 AcrR family transcriptional regulator [Microlunatus parietis]
MRTVNPQRHAARVEEILTGAANSFAQHGYANTTITELQRATGCSSGTLFHYFSDKASMFRAIIEAGCADQWDRLAAIDAGAPTAFWSAVDILRSDFTDPNAPGLVGAILERRSADPDLEKILADHEKLVLDLLSGMIKRLQRRRLMDKSLTPDEAARWVVWTIDGIILHVNDHDFDPAQASALLSRSLRSTLRLTD